MSPVFPVTSQIALRAQASGPYGSALSPFPPFPKAPRFGFIELVSLPVTFLKGGTIRVERAILFNDPILGTRVIPERFVSDGTSAPSPTWALVGHPYSFSLLPASLLHDWELAAASRAHNFAQPHLSRREIDQLYYRALRLWGCGRVRAGLIYAGVRSKAIVLGRDFPAREATR